MIPEWDELDSIKYESIAHFGVKELFLYMKLI